MKPNRLRILIADDHQLIRDGVRRQLRCRHNYVVVAEASNGAQAAKQAEILQPDIAILDMSMPVADGLQATRLIRQSVPNCQILMLTMHDSDLLVRQALEAGARGFVLKADLSKCLLTAVRRIARGRIYLTPRVSELVAQGILETKKQSRCVEGTSLRPSRREAEILRLLARGQSNKIIGSNLCLSTRTVESYRARVMRKLGFSSAAELMNYAIRNELSAGGQIEFYGTVLVQDQ